MAFYKSIFIFSFIICVKSKLDAPFTACPKDDVPCLSTAAETFFTKTFEGVENLNIKKIDPLTIAALDVIENENELVLHFTNMVVTGLKNLKVSDVKLDADKKSVVIQMKGDLSIVSDVQVELIKTQKSFGGHYSASGYVIATSKYTYSIVQEDGADHFSLGPETNSCEIVTEPKLTLKVELKDDADKEEYAKMPDLDKSSLRKKTVCEIVSVAMETILSNLRAAAKAYPKEAFFTDL